MCLYPYKKYRLPKKAKKDIKCFKVLRTYGNVVETPYQYINLDKETLAGKKPFVSEILDMLEHKMVETTEAKFRIHHADSDTISCGAIHTFSLLKDARKEKEWLLSLKEVKEYNYIIYECIIPQGTLYIKGLFDCAETSFASQQITFVKQVLD